MTICAKCGGTARYSNRNCIACAKATAKLKRRTPAEDKDYHLRALADNPIRARAYTLVSNARSRARQQGVPTDITSKWLYRILKRGFCQETGIRFDFESKRGPFVPSLDRITAERGYTQSNVKVVVFIHNMARHNWGDDALYTYIQHMAILV